MLWEITCQFAPTKSRTLLTHLFRGTFKNIPEWEGAFSIAFKFHFQILENATLEIYFCHTALHWFYSNWYVCWHHVTKWRPTVHEHWNIWLGLVVSTSKHHCLSCSDDFTKFASTNFFVKEDLNYQKTKQLHLQRDNSSYTEHEKHVYKFIRQKKKSARGSSA